MKRAFTLAEVLITLGIIGIVAALTIPSAIQHHKNKVIIIALNKSYSELSNVQILIEKDFGENINNIVLNSTLKEFKEILTAYYQDAIDCDKAKCFKDINIYKTYSGKNVTNSSTNFDNFYFGNTAFLTKDGRLISISRASSSKSNIRVI